MAAFIIMPLKMTLLFSILLLSNAHAFQGQSDREAFPQIDSAIEASMDRHSIPGLALVIVKGDSLLMGKGYGYADIERQAKIDPAKTVFRCGSVSKSFTATAVMLLAAKNQLDLHAPVASYLNDDEVKLFGLSGKGVSLHHLLTHTSGFDDHLFGSHVSTFDKWLPLKEYFKEHPVQFISDPGHVLNYNDKGITLAGYVVEKVSGISFYDFVRQYIFDPLEMHNSSFNPVPDQRIQGALAQSYFYDGHSFVPYDYDYILSYPAAGLLSSPEDIAKFLKMHLSGGMGVLSAESVQKMHERQFANHPELRGWCYGFAEWFENGQRFVFKDGQATGFNSRLMMSPDSAWGFYMVWNRSIFNKGGSINSANRIKHEVTALLIDLFFDDVGLPGSSVSKPAPYSGNDHGFEGNYRAVNLGMKDWSRILTLGMQTTVENKGNGSWRLSGNDYVRVDDLLFKYHTGQEFYAAFSLAENKAKYLHFGTGSYEKAPWFESARLQLSILLLFHFLFLVLVIFSVRCFKKTGRLPYLVLGMGSLLNLSAFPLLALGFFAVDFQVLFKGATPFMAFASWLPFIGCTMVTAAIVALRGKKAANWLVWMSMLSLSILPYLFYWNFPV